MIHFFRRKTKKRSQADIEQTLDRMRADPHSEPPLDDEEVTGVIEGALERLRKTHRNGTQRLQTALDDSTRPTVPEEP